VTDFFLRLGIAFCIVVIIICLKILIQGNIELTRMVYYQYKDKIKKWWRNL